jgi:hypothetical protein
MVACLSKKAYTLQLLIFYYTPNKRMNMSFFKNIIIFLVKKLVSRFYKQVLFNYRSQPLHKLQIKLQKYVYTSL